MLKNKITRSNKHVVNKKTLLSLYKIILLNDGIKQITIILSYIYVDRSYNRDNMSLFDFLKLR